MNRVLTVLAVLACLAGCGGGGGGGSAPTTTPPPPSPTPPPPPPPPPDPDPTDGGETIEDVFGSDVSPIVQAKCVHCHVQGGVSELTRLVFVPASNADHEVLNLQVFRDFLEEVEDGANLILNKVQGVDHGGGVQAAAGTQDYSNLQRFLGLLGEAGVSADGIWSRETGADEWMQLFMHDGFVIMHDSGTWPSSRAFLAGGVYQISGERITAQFTAMGPQIEISGFDGAVTEESIDGAYLDLTFTTTDGQFTAQLHPRGRDSITLDELVGGWSGDGDGRSLMIHADGSLFYQDAGGCAAAGNLRVHEMDLLVLSFDVQSCQNDDRNGAYRGIGYSRGRDWEIGQTLWIAAVNDTNPGQFFSLWLFPN